MDEIDRKLLHALQEDATLSVAQLADRVGLSPTPCWKRVQKLEAQGVITRRVAIVDPTRIGVALSVFVGVEAGAHTPEWLESFTTGVTAMPEVMAVYRMAGDIDYLLHVAVAGMAELVRSDFGGTDGRAEMFNRASAEWERCMRTRWIPGSTGNPRWWCHWVLWRAGCSGPPVHMRLRRKQL